MGDKGVRVRVLFGARTKKLLKFAQNARFCVSFCAHLCVTVGNKMAIYRFGPGFSNSGLIPHRSNKVKTL